MSALKKTSLTAQLDGIELRACEYSPAALPKADLFCLPGGGASAAYFDLAPNFSFAKRMCKAGYRIITMDHPGTASNPLPKTHPFLTPRRSASYIARALEQWRSRAPLIGIGHSMGGMMISLVHAHNQATEQNDKQNGKHNTGQVFAGLGLLGSSAGGLAWGLSKEEKTYIDKPEAFSRELERLTLAKFKTPFPKGMGGPSGKSITFGGESPELTQKLREVSCELFAAGGMMSMTRGSFKTEVKALNIPIFFAFGDHDIGIAPKDAPKDYINAARTELVILENTGHNHFAFSSVETLCNRLDHWASSLV